MLPGGDTGLNVVFDLGGVVLTWNPAAIAASAFDASREQALVLDQVFGHPDWAELDRGTLPVAKAVERAAHRTGLDERRLTAMFHAVPSFLVPMPDSLDLIAAVREAGNRLFALSNLHRSSLAHVENVLGIFDLFDARVDSCEVGLCKPEDAIYRLLLERHGLDPPDTVFIDDVQSNLDAATAFGMRTIKFDDAGSCRAQLQALGCI